MQLTWLVLAALLTACGKTVPAESTGAPSSTSATSPSNAADGANAPLVLAPKDAIRWMQAPAGTADVATLVKTSLAREHADGRTLVIYVGATWCEPCQRFHHAVDSGELDASFPRLSVLAFDADTDRDDLKAAGYTSKYIPLFALPGADGRASGRQIEGGTKGEHAAAEIVPRLRGLIASGS